MKNNLVLSIDNNKMIISWNLKVKGKKDTCSHLWRKGDKVSFCLGRLRRVYVEGEDMNSEKKD